MALGLIWLIMFLCLMISILKYTFGAILKWSVPGARVKKDYSYQPTVSVVLPCYNEGKAVYDAIASISRSNYPSDKFEVIAQDDCSVDDSYQWMLQAQRDFTNLRVVVDRNAVNSGKARSVCNALSHSTAEIVISVDSDCIFDPEAIRELTACFSEPKMGAVGGRVGVSNPNDGVITAIQTFIYYAAFHLYKVPENWTRSVGCISGCLFAKLHPNAVLHLVLTPLGAVVALLMALNMLTGDPMAWAGPAPVIVYLVIAGVLGEQHLGDDAAPRFPAGP